MAGRYFDIPFARDGDRTSTPDQIQLDGSVSFQDGFGFDYERPAINPLTGQPDPLYKPIPRDRMNGLFHDITESLGIVQQQGFADWTPNAAPYPAQAWVRHDGNVWRSIIASNSFEPGIEGWVPVAEEAAGGWKLVESGYSAKSGDRVYLNNRTESPTLNLPATPKTGEEVLVMPYPFTQYSRYGLIVNGSGNAIMGINESMTVDEDYAVFACRYIGKSVGWFVERIGRLGASFSVSTVINGSYGAGVRQKYDATIIKGAPMIMMVHGGGWVAGDKISPNLANGQYVSSFPDEYGFSISAINYTLATSSSYSYPTAVNDVIAAAEHFRSIGVTGLVVLGTSAGANLAALAVIERPDLFDGFIGYYGAYDLTKLGEFDAGVQANISTYTNTPSLASPTLRASGWSTPAVLIHGDADAAVSVQQSIDFGAAIGVAPIIVSGGAHSFKVFGDVGSPLPGYAKQAFNLVDEACIQ